MLTKGIYVTQMHKGLHEGEVDEMLAYVKANGYTDLYVMVGHDSEGLRIRPSMAGYIGYIFANKGDLHIHIVVRGLSLWSFGHELETYNSDYTMSDGQTVFFDPTTTFAQNNLINKFSALANASPAESILIDYFYYANQYIGKGTLEEKKAGLDAIISGLRANTSIPIGVVVKTEQPITETLNEYESWFANGWIDFISPMIVYAKFSENLQRFNAMAVPKRYTFFGEADGKKAGNHSIYFRYYGNN